jgi:hypothetical protein
MTSLHPDLGFMSPKPHLNWKRTNWDTFTSILQNLSTKTYPLWSSVHENPTQHNLDAWVTLLHDIILSAVVISTPLLLLSPHSKQWWTAEIEYTHMAMSQAHWTWQRIHLPHQHADYCSLCNEHFCHICHTKDSLWKEYLSQAEGADIWAVFRYTNPHHTQITPPIRSMVGDETHLYVDFDSKVQAFQALFPPLPRIPPPTPSSIGECSAQQK